MKQVHFSKRYLKHAMRNLVTGYGQPPLPQRRKRRRHVKRIRRRYKHELVITYGFAVGNAKQLIRVTEE